MDGYCLMQDYFAHVAIIQRSESSACGIAIFSRHVADGLRKRGWNVKQYSVKYERYGLRPITLINYVPSMWAGTSDQFVRIMAEASQGRVVVLLHGVYPRSRVQHRLETPCPELPDHVESIWKYADRVLALSRGCAEAFLTWTPAPRPRATVTATRHPGVFGAAPRFSRPSDGYVFLGGIVRGKKNFASPPAGKLLDQLAGRGLRVWVHATNNSQPISYVNAWRTTSGLLSDTEWASVLHGSCVVGCPYSTNIQTVSGLAVEALSVGTPVITTRSPFGLELREFVPNMVMVEDRLEEWPALINRLSDHPHTQNPKIPTWSEFIHVIEEALRFRNIVCAGQGRTGG